MSVSTATCSSTIIRGRRRMSFVIDGCSTAALGLALLFSSACTECPTTPDSGTKPRSCPVGDLSLPIEVELVHHDENSTMTRTSSVAPVPLFQGEQGGHLLVIGVRARNLDGCSSVLTI